MLICPRCLTRFASPPPVACPSDGAELLRLGESSEPRLGTVLAGRYLLLDVLGAGGMGVVFDAWQLTTARRVAIKVLHPALRPGVDKTMLVERFKREARVTASLNSPHTITIHDFDELPDGSLYLVMKLLEGEALDSLLDRRGKLELAEVRDIAVQVCESLIEAHARGIVHRDLKPANVMVEPRAKRGEWFATVLDFGIAKVIERQPATALTETGQTLGTLVYMSPEQALGQPTSGASDIYSLGVMLFEMLTGSPPFVSAVPLTLMTMHVQTRAPHLWEHLEDEPRARAFDVILQRCLAKAPHERFATATELRDALATLDLGPPRHRGVRPTVPVEVAPHKALASSSPSSPDTMDTSGGTPRSTRSRVMTWSVALSMLLLSVAGFVLIATHFKQPTRSPESSAIEPPDDDESASPDEQAGLDSTRADATELDDAVAIARVRDADVSGAPSPEPPLSTDGREGSEVEGTDPIKPTEGSKPVVPPRPGRPARVQGSPAVPEKPAVAATSATIRDVRVHSGPRTAPEIREALKGRQQALVTCFERAFGATAGTIHASIYVRQDGGVSAVNVTPKDAPQVEAFAACASPILKALTFPSGAVEPSLVRVTLGR